MRSTECSAQLNKGSFLIEYHLSATLWVLKASQHINILEHPPSSISIIKTSHSIAVSHIAYPVANIP